MELRPYQVDISKEASDTLKALKIVYLSMEVRTGKTLTALNTCKLYGAVNVLFLTKKRAIKSIEDDYNNFGFSFKLTVINNESAHKFIGDYDLVISDEHHRNGAFPKPNKMTRFIKDNYSHLPMIFLSGTPHPESYSQIYHQFWCSKYSPFTEKSFYKWAKVFVNIKERHLGYAVVKDYSEAMYSEFKHIVKPYMITFTQAEAGFETKVIENIIKVKMLPITYQLARKLQKDKFIIAQDKREIMADTAVKEMQKLHQIYSGTVLFEDGSSRVFDLSKAEYMKCNFKSSKLGIFYKFKAEYQALKQVYGDSLTNDLEEFNNTDKHIALQIVSGSEGISLKAADFLVYYNIDFSSKNYWQSRDRLTTMQRKSNDVYWMFSEDGIEEKIYKKVLDKKSYTLSVFKKDFK
tara:strand:+ start:1820 stop:3037 length:1218 start_codon:yes stop_codon:yes gene_type:complete